ncbi:lysylphosphatidylglycerol synthase transmembrane domain-containing protein [Methylococcus sp. EFPC2]|uniref:lysylphosphatidylglycerol synthase transmembrane domain-containing protein n=1 Tax=Methylococcus sp. EFPC2 TaxID=2812648 RepID=UPI001967AA10|nr:lysylphosphatidylglycerol synthase transmembrane domain-containing protein [Methylococcus sp. EFPC2]QSA98469.1 flippase-like domain-containing protein [Methylococcus sp. EFPC2]
MTQHTPPVGGRDILGQFSPARVLLPVSLGLGIVIYMLYQELIKNGLTPAELFTRLEWRSETVYWLMLGGVMMALREFGYMWQLRILTDRKLSWRASFEVIMLWNFFAAVSPSMVGGAAVAVFMLGKEGISVGRATAIIFTTVYFDQVFFISIPLLVSLVIPQDDIFAPLRLIPSDLLGTGIYGAFWSAWGGIAVYVILLIAALFVAPTWINWWLTRLFLLPFMARWRAQGLHMANELMIASKDLRDRSFAWWMTAWAATSVAWLGRYLVLNCVLAAFSQLTLGPYDHLLAAGRQAVLWIVMLVSPTPGSAGVAELGFSWLYKDMVPAGLALTLAIVWRLISYYPHLLIGLPVMTRWIKRVYGRDVR